MADLPVTKFQRTAPSSTPSPCLGGEYRVHGDDELLIVEKSALQQLTGNHEHEDRLILAAQLKTDCQENPVYPSEIFPQVEAVVKISSLAEMVTDDWNECSFSFRVDQILSKPTQASLPQAMNLPHQDDSLAGPSSLAG